MTTPELLALSLGLSILVAALAWGAVRLFETTTADPILRERAWTAALYLPLAPVLLVAVLLATPPAVVEAPPPSDAVVTVRMSPTDRAASPSFDMERVALALLALALLLGLARGAGLARRTVRLHRLIASTGPADAVVLDAVRALATQAGVAMPRVRLCPSSGEALVSGVVHPVLVLPEGLAADPASLRTVCAHELTHLKRGDHRALWVEEALLAVLAINPVLRPIRDRRAAAREEACDAQVLARADGDARRLYARALLDALRAPARPHVPALTFTSTRRIFVMHRLKAVLSPAPVAGRRSRLAVLGLGVALSAVAATGSVALAARREPVVTPRPAVAAEVPASVPVVKAEPVARPAASIAPTPVAAPSDAPRAAPEPVAAPQARTITNPSWTRHPMPLSYPAAALERNLTSGRAELSCAVEADGRVSACTIVSEDPVGAGFGAAALEAAAEARLSPRSVEGVAVGGTVRFTIRFSMAAE